MSTGDQMQILIADRASSLLLTCVPSPVFLTRVTLLFRPPEFLSAGGCKCEPPYLRGWHGGYVCSVRSWEGAVQPCWRAGSAPDAGLALSAGGGEQKWPVLFPALSETLPHDTKLVLEPLGPDSEHPHRAVFLLSAYR